MNYSQFFEEEEEEEEFEREEPSQHEESEESDEALESNTKKRTFVKRDPAPETLAKNRPRRNVAKVQSDQFIYGDDTALSDYDISPTKTKSRRVRKNSKQLHLKEEMMEHEEENVHDHNNMITHEEHNGTNSNNKDNTNNHQPVNALTSEDIDTLFNENQDFIDTITNNIENRKMDVPNNSNTTSIAITPPASITNDKKVNNNHAEEENGKEQPSLSNISSISTQPSDEETPKKKRKKDDDDDFVLGDNDDEEEEENIVEEISDEEDVEEVTQKENNRGRGRPRKYQKRVSIKETEEEEEDQSDEEEGDGIKKRLRPRTQVQLQPYSHSPQTPNIPSKISLLKQQENVLVAPTKLKFNITNESDSSSDSDVDDNNSGELSKSRYAHIAPLNQSQLKKKPSADIDPLFSKPIGFDSIGGLHRHINALKEMVVLPLLYPEVFDKFDITPPRGVLFYGPPGTGKTLLARALASTCTDSSNRPIAFFMRKGADILSKWVGEAEKQLRLLFDEAKKLQPSIIFFDEIDGLAPVRSSKQDYIHSSIVSTLLALMDGLDSRGQVVVIGATNRIDSIDPALRRPGRFDRELIFTLPSKSARKEILNIHTKNWKPPVAEDLKEEICSKCVGYCGADIKALCAESALNALKRKFPQVYTSNTRLQIDLDSVGVTKVDFLRAMKSITPASHRSSVVYASPLPVNLEPLLSSKLETLKELCKAAFPVCIKSLNKDSIKEESHTMVAVSGEEGNDQIIPALFDDFEGVDEKTFEDSDKDYFINPPTFKPWILIHGEAGMGQNYIASALLYCLEEFPLFSLGFESLITHSSAKSEVEAIINVVADARKNSPSILWIPKIDEWWSKSTDLMKSTLITLLEEIPSSIHILVLSTCSTDNFSDLPSDVQELFVDYRFSVDKPVFEERKNMFHSVVTDILRKPLNTHTVKKVYPRLPPAPTTINPTNQLTSEKEEKHLRKEEEKTLRELRVYFREITARLINSKVYTLFVRPPSDEVRGVMTDNDDGTDNNSKLYILDILSKVEARKYLTVKDYLKDIERIVTRAEQYGKQPSTTVQNLMVVSKANNLYDVVKSSIRAIPEELSRKCNHIAKRRRQVEKLKKQKEIENNNASSSTDPIVIPDPIIIDIEQDNQQENQTKELTQANSLNQPIQPTPTENNLDTLMSVATTAETGHTQNTELNTTAINGEHTEITQTTDEKIDDNKIDEVEVTIDKDRLEKWFNEFLQLTSDFTVDQLDKCFSYIYKTIYRYRFSQDRNPLLAELEKYSESLRRKLQQEDKK
ncbi:hypothetical protein ABK040_001546 [Willaertia magna]